MNGSVKDERNNPLWQDIQAQAQNLRKVIDHLYGQEYANLKTAAAFLGTDKPIIFIGMTSAAYLCHPAEFYLCNQGRLATVMQASDALYSMLPALQDTRVVINSRSGETAEVVKLAAVLKERKIPFLAVTNEPESSLAALAELVLWTNSRKDDLVSINIITAMMMATLVLAAEVIGQMNGVRDSLEILPALIDQAVQTAWEQGDELFKLFCDVNPIYLLHRGVSKGAANCARLVIEEVARRPAIAMEAGEFRQGPIEVVDKNFGSMIFVLKGAAGNLNCQLADDIHLKGGGVYIVGNPSICQIDQPHMFLITAEAGIFQSVLEVIPSQILAFKMAQHHGWEPGRVRYISKVITSETGIPSERK